MLQHALPPNGKARAKPTPENSLQRMNFLVTDINRKSMRFDQVLLGAFAKLQKRLLAPSCQSVLMEQLASHYMDFYEINIGSFFLKSVKKIQVTLKSDKNNGYFT